MFHASTFVSRNVTYNSVFQQAIQRSLSGCRIQIWFHRCSPSYIAPWPCSSDQWSSTHSSNVIAHAPPSPDSDENRTFSLPRDSPRRAFDSRISPCLTVPLDLLWSGVISVATPSNFKCCRTPEVSSNDDLDLMWLASRPSVVGVHSWTRCQCRSCRLSFWVSQSDCPQFGLAGPDCASEYSLQPEWVAVVQIPFLFDTL